MNVKVGGRLTWRGGVYEVIVIRAMAATLRDEQGVECEVSVEELNRAAEPVADRPLRALADLGEIEQESDPELTLWREAIRRIERESEAYGAKDRAVAREAAHLSKKLGRTISTRTVYRQLKAFTAHGVSGLRDRRSGDLRASRARGVDARVIEALNTVLTGRKRASTTSKAVVLEQVTVLVRKQFGDEVRMPSRATFYRLLESEDRGRFSFGSAKTRESLAMQPDGEFGRRTALRPGEQVQIDTTRLDVMVRIDEATIGRPELTIMLDVATRPGVRAVAPHARAVAGAPAPPRGRARRGWRATLRDRPQLVLRRGHRRRLAELVRAPRRPRRPLPAPRRAAAPPSLVLPQLLPRRLESSPSVQAGWRGATVADRRVPSQRRFAAP